MKICFPGEKYSNTIGEFAFTKRQRGRSQRCLINLMCETSILPKDGLDYDPSGRRRWVECDYCVMLTRKKFNERPVIFFILDDSGSFIVTCGRGTCAL